MCTNGRWIYNRFSNQKVWVRCGKCDACKQENALKRTNRIRLHKRAGYICLFVTLTYTNDYVPYILKSELSSDNFDVNVYRNACGRFVYSRKNGLRFKKELGITILDSKYIDSFYRCDSSLYSLRPLKGLSSDHIGICYYPDLQDFIKRFRINYERENKQSLSFDYFAVSEYGGYSYRPHFHLLLFIPSETETKVRASILKAWPYADSRRTAKFIEVARDASSYVASYVNGSFNSSTCLSSDAFRQKHSQSKNLGVVVDLFRLPSLLDMVERRDLHVYFEKKFDGESSITPVLVPQYVINRYFPKFKGMRWFTDDALRGLLVEPARLFETIGNYEQDIKINIFGNRNITINSRFDYPFPNPCYDFGRYEIYHIAISLMNAQLRFILETGLTAYDFAHYYINIWNLYSSTLLSDSYSGIKEINDFEEFYFNSDDLLFNIVSSPTLQGLEFNPNPNTFHECMQKTFNFSRIYKMKDKTKKIVNMALSQTYDV